MNYQNIKILPSNKHVLLTKKGLDRLKAQLDLLNKERSSMCKRLLRMDKREKEEYIASTNAINMLEKNEMEIMRITDVLMHADVVEKKKKHSDVRLGSTVSLLIGDQPAKYTIVNSIEADPSAHLISKESPLGKALLGKKKRSKIRLSNSKGQHFRYKVLDIG